MSTKTIGAGSISPTNRDCKSGQVWTVSASGTNVYNTTLYSYSNVSMTLNVSSCKYYSTYGYFNVKDQSGNIIGRTRQWNVAENSSYVQASGAAAKNITFTLINVNTQYALQATSFTIVGARSNSGTGNICNIRSGATGTITVTYTQTLNNTAPNSPIIIYPSTRANPATYNSKPWFRIQTTTDPDGNSMQIGYSLYDSTAGVWKQSLTWLSTWYGNYATVDIQSPVDIIRDHTYMLLAYTRDTSYVQCATPIEGWFLSYSMPQPSNVYIDDNQIDYLQTQINVVRNYYNLNAYNFTTCDLGAPITYNQINELDIALQETPHIATTSYAPPAVGSKAYLSNTITQLRTLVLNS